MLKKVEKGGKGAVAPFLSAVSSRFFFFFVFASFEFRRPDYHETKPEKKKDISVFKQKRIRVDGAFYFNWGTKRRIKMTEVQLEN